MSAQDVFNKSNLDAIAELQGHSHAEELPDFVKDLENYLLDDPGLYENEERCVKMVLLLKRFRYYSDIILRIVEKGGHDEE